MGALRIQVQLDLGWLLRRDLQPLREAVAEAAGVGLEQVLMGCNHSHSAGNVQQDRLGEPGGELIPGYLEALREKLADAARAAIAELRPVWITYGVGRCSLAAHRDYWDDEAGIFVCGFNPDAPADDTVVVAAVTGDGGERLASLVNYGCHPTTLAWQNSLLSPDYYGACREVVEQVTGAPCLFLLGACGELGPRLGYTGDTAVADRNGRQLGYAALSALEALGPPAHDLVYAGPVVSGATLGAWEYQPFSGGRCDQVERFAGGAFELPLPLRALPSREEVLARRAERLAAEEAALAAGETEHAGEWRALAERDTRMLGCLANLPEDGVYRLQAGAWRIGDAFWVAVEGEVYSYLQTELRRRFPDHPVMVSPLINGWDPAYLPPRDLYGRGIYQEQVALLAPGCLEALTEAMAKRLEALS